MATYFRLVTSPRYKRDVLGRVMIFEEIRPHIIGATEEAGAFIVKARTKNWCLRDIFSPTYVGGTGECFFEGHWFPSLRFKEVDPEAAERLMKLLDERFLSGDPRVKAIRENKLVGKGSCSHIDECFEDDELSALLDKEHVIDPSLAVGWALDYEELFYEAALNTRWGEDDDAQVKAYREWKERRDEDNV